MESSVYTLILLVYVQFYKVVREAFHQNQRKNTHRIFRGVSRDFEKRVALYDGEHGWLTKNVLGFRWSKKAKITLETIPLWKIFLSAFSNFFLFYIQ